MASLAETLIAGQQRSSETAVPNLSNAISQGAQIGQMVEKNKQAQQQLTLDKAELGLKQVDGAIKLYGLAGQAKTAAKKNFLFDLADKRMMAASPNANPENLQMMRVDDDRRRTAISAYQKTRLTEAGVSPEFLAKTVGAFEGSPEEFGKEVDKVITEQGKTKRAEIASEKFETQKEQFKIKTLDKMKNTFDARMIRTKSTERVLAANNAINLLASDSPVASEAVKTQLARLSGEVGNLTEGDQARFSGSRALAARFRQLIRTGLTGKLTKTNRKELTELANTFRTNVVNDIRQQAERDAEVTANLLGISKEEAMKAINLKIPAPAPIEKKVSKLKTNFPSLNAETFKSLSSSALDALVKESGMTVQEIKDDLGVE